MQEQREHEKLRKCQTFLNSNATYECLAESNFLSWYFKIKRVFFFLQVRKKDQINIETKNKTVRFIGELTKFKMFSKNDTLHCLKVGG